MKRCHLLIIFLLLSGGVSARDYSASLFGIKSNGVTDNTASIQKAIDFISAQGGGTLVFYVGRYLTGSVQLKSGVYLRLEEGAVLAGSSSPYDYGTAGAIVVADGQTNVGVSGRGVIEGSGLPLVDHTRKLVAAGYLSHDVKPALVAFTHCTNVSVSALHLWNSAYVALSLNGCSDVSVSGVDVDGKDIPSSEGVVLSGCKKASLKDMFIKVSAHPLSMENNQGVDIQHAITDTGKLLTGS